MMVCMIRIDVVSCVLQAYIISPFFCRQCSAAKSTIVWNALRRTVCDYSQYIIMINSRSKNTLKIKDQNNNVSVLIEWWLCLYIHT